MSKNITYSNDGTVRIWVEVRVGNGEPAGMSLELRPEQVTRDEVGRFFHDAAHATIDRVCPPDTAGAANRDESWVARRQREQSEDMCKVRRGFFK